MEMFVTHPICDAARNLGAVWGRNFSYPCQILYLPQNANSPAAVTYLRNEYARLQRCVEAIAGRPVKEDDLRRSMAVYNRNRALLRELYAIKRETPWLVSADEAYVLIAIGGLIPREEHNELLETALPQIAARPKQETRQDSPRLRRRLLRAAAAGYASRHRALLLRRRRRPADRTALDSGRRAPEGDPLFNLAYAYLEKSSYSPVQHDLRKPKEKMLLERIRNSRGRVPQFSPRPRCASPVWTSRWPTLHALDAEGIPYFISEFEEKMTTFDHMEIQLETFVENMLFS